MELLSLLCLLCCVEGEEISLWAVLGSVLLRLHLDVLALLLLLRSARGESWGGVGCTCVSPKALFTSP